MRGAVLDCRVIDRLPAGVYVRTRSVHLAPGSRGRPFGTSLILTTIGFAIRLQGSDSAIKAMMIALIRND